MNFIKRVIALFVLRIVVGFIIAGIFVFSYFLIMDFVVGGFTEENMKGIVIVTGIYILAFPYLFINTPMKYALIVTAFTGLGSEILRRNWLSMPPRNPLRMN
ncbi:hypothetical protein QYF52_19310 [Paenibacillus polymyxa]|uniref:hypothetical protein n=1 Tax=Paenibacillus polymyxa TaxID=1406 RepID=UPI0025B6FB58|nr:hypothetical protein [Paenibacillus polymyxa]MDN4080097.1 hypothetical protein [Paenibacillus polymyxa]MDN4105081.1 hypothetical protein [Paenibacillus polymyxa]MDN4115418.1 hypothetical protein [Paenibacillus polymyxa]